MKKIIAILALSIAFSYSAKAQETIKSASAQTREVSNTKSDTYKVIEELDRTVKLDAGLKNDLTNLLFMRQEAVSNAQNEDEKKSLFTRYTNKFLGGLTPEQLESLKKNKELYISLTEYKKN